MKDFRELAVWHKAHRLALKVYAATRKFPREGLYGLTGQMRGSSSSVPMNIAESRGRGSDLNSAASCRLPRDLPVGLGANWRTARNRRLDDRLGFGRLKCLEGEWPRHLMPST